MCDCRGKGYSVRWEGPEPSYNTCWKCPASTQLTEFLKESQLELEDYCQYAEIQWQSEQKKRIKETYGKMKAWAGREEKKEKLTAVIQNAAS